MDDLLNELLKNGILDETVICKIETMKNQEYLKMHRYKIYQNKDGRWVTYLPGRKRIQRKDRAELEALVIEYYKKNRYDPTSSGLTWQPFVHETTRHIPSLITPLTQKGTPCWHPEWYIIPNLASPKG